MQVHNMRRTSLVAMSITASLILTAGLSLTSLPFEAQAKGTGTIGEGTSWTIPTQAKTNALVKDGKTYKVITTWANAWATNGPDYLGISNSCNIVSSAGNKTNLSDLSQATNSTMLGIWASDANESPNAYNWNMFYNLYANTTEGIEKGLATSDMETTLDKWDSSAGIYGPFKYRPEIIWQSHGVDETNAPGYIKLINDMTYYSSSDAYDDGNGTPTETGKDSQYYCPGDEDYDPFVYHANYMTTLTFTDSFYIIAEQAEKIEADTANLTGTATDWKGMNALPRTTRYEKKATEIALDIEKVTRASVYYVLSKINDGTVKRKKVAFLSSAPDADSTTCEVVAFDFIDQQSRGKCGGYVSVSPLVVDQLAPGEATGTGGANLKPNGEWSDAKNADVPYTTYNATADDLASCDIVWAVNGAMTNEQLQSWIKSHATSASNAQAAENIEYMTTLPTIMAGGAYTAEKLIAGAYNINFFYPELFPNMELLAYWYDNIYHIKDEYIATCMGWTFANATLPSNTTLSGLADDYDSSSIEAKFLQGYAYYKSSSSTDPTLSRVLSGTDLKGSKTYDNGDGDVGTYNFDDIKPSEYMVAWGDAELAKQAANDKDDEDKGLAKGEVAKVSGVKYKVTSSSAVSYYRASNVKSTATVPAQVKINGKVYKVTGIAGKAFAKAGKVKKLVVKSTKLTKKSVKNSLKNSKISTVKVPKSCIAKYKKYFAKSNSGKKVIVK